MSARLYLNCSMPSALSGWYTLIDRFGVTRDRLSALCRNLTTQQIAASAVFPGIELTEDEAIREQRLTNAIDRLQDDELSPAFDALQTSAGLGGAEQDRLAASAFSEVLGAAADVRLLSLAQWKSQSTLLISEIAAIPTLFVFDDDFRLEGGDSHDGRRLIIELHSRLQQYKYAYALLTHNASTDEAESQLEKTIADTSPEIQDFVVVIAKARLTGEDRDRFVHRLKATLLFRLFRRLRLKLQEAASAAHDTAVNRVESLGVDAFERIIYRSSREEGAWSPETLVRVFGVLHEREIRLKLRGDESLHEAISEIDPLCTIDTGGVSDEVQKIAEELQQAEVYDSEADLNPLHLPVDCGDFFQSDQGDRYVVVAQACDLAVRQDGRRRKDKRDERQLLALVKVGSRTKRKGTSFSHHEFELCHFIEGLDKSWFGEVNQTIQVPAWLLDLAVLNPQGVCRISDNETALPLLTLPWRKRLQILKERAAAVVALAAAVAIPAGAEREELLRSLIRLPLSTTFSVAIEPVARKQGDSWQLNVGLRRVLRLRERYAAALLSYFANYMARPGQPHDLTNLG